MKRPRISTAVLMTATVLLLGCRGMDERTVYRLAEQSAREQLSAQGRVEVGHRREALVALGKNAARVDVPYVLHPAAGGERRGQWTAWCKRIRLQWEVDRAGVAPF